MKFMIPLMAACCFALGGCKSACCGTCSGEGHSHATKACCDKCPEACKCGGTGDCCKKAQ